MSKHCLNTLNIFPNIVQILPEYCPSILQILSRYCPNIDQNIVYKLSKYRIDKYSPVSEISSKQTQLGVPHSRIQVELEFILQAGTCQILNFAQGPSG